MSRADLCNFWYCLEKYLKSLPLLSMAGKSEVRSCPINDQWQPTIDLKFFKAVAIITMIYKLEVEELFCLLWRLRKLEKILGHPLGALTTRISYHFADFTAKRDTRNTTLGRIT
ncbi:hypothetical protein OUZ56_005706 [Daphnia magna]|uniref:Uncharacterized protein n=1 Tax=Daphnia magna TaxID=35525 RepID=A0ABQ9YTM8_9CRUS|nr:hypothetical protein OUZ56_005706 [Daphnia magna]